MSHVTKIEMPDTLADLKALAAGCKRLGLELMTGQTKFKWYGQHVGDYPLPELPGYTKEEVLEKLSAGRCEHAIRDPKNPGAYEIALWERKDGKGYHVIYDFWSGGRGMSEAVGFDGKKCRKLSDAYKIAQVKRRAMRAGQRVVETKTKDGRVQLEIHA